MSATPSLPSVVWVKKFTTSSGFVSKVAAKMVESKLSFPSLSAVTPRKLNPLAESATPSTRVERRSCNRICNIRVVESPCRGPTVPASGSEICNVFNPESVLLYFPTKAAILLETLSVSRETFTSKGLPTSAAFRVRLTPSSRSVMTLPDRSTSMPFTLSWALPAAWVCHMVWAAGSL